MLSRCSRPAGLRVDQILERGQHVDACRAALPVERWKERLLDEVTRAFLAEASGEVKHVFNVASCIAVDSPNAYFLRIVRNYTIQSTRFVGSRA